MKNKSNPVFRRRVAANRERARAKRSMLKRVAARWRKRASATRQRKAKRRTMANRARAQAKRSMLKRVTARWKKRAVKTPMQRQHAWTKGMSAGELRRRNNRDVRMARAVLP